MAKKNAKKERNERTRPRMFKAIPFEDAFKNREEIPDFGNLTVAQALKLGLIQEILDEEDSFK